MSAADDFIPYLDQACASLKDFQRASMEVLFDGLYGEPPRPCMLLADEVGLGKTVVAKGLIAKVIRQRMDAGRRKPLKVTYICSNQVLAKANLAKLNPFPGNAAINASNSRIAYLAYEGSQKSDVPTATSRSLSLELSTLTPATSFNVSDGLGNRRERVILYAALCQDLKMRNQQAGLQWLLKGGVQRMEGFKDELDKAVAGDRLRPDLAERFINTLHRQKLTITLNAVYNELPQRRDQSEYSLYEATLALAKIVEGRNWNRLRSACWHVAALLRECLVDCCLRYVDADLYILDEFQRFRSLIDQDSQEEEARIARKIFSASGNKARILLLSATPFKPFTGDHDQEQGEDHFKDFNRVLGFLLRNDTGLLAHYSHHRQALYQQLHNLRHDGVAGLTTTHRDEVEAVLRSVICRTEKNSVAQNPGALIEDVWKDPAAQLKFGPGDIQNFIATDRLAQALATLGKKIPKPVEYCKSALYPLSFLDHYQFKELLRANRNNPTVAATLATTKDAWLDLEKINHYQWRCDETPDPSSNPSNARLRLLLHRAVGPQGATLLWIPPSLCYYGLAGGFQGSEGFSKTLVFSSWIMVPRMIATLVSYEVERHTVGHPTTVNIDQETKPRQYFSEKRHPVRQIQYRRRSAEAGGQLADLSNFTLVYPSPTLCGLVDPLDNLRTIPRLSLDQLIARTAGKFQAMIDRCGLSRWSTPNGVRERWYWAAPLLLDLADEQSKKEVRAWLSDGPHWDRETWFRHGPTEDVGIREAYGDYLQTCADDPQQIGLGPMPDDLAEVLAHIALGSPAVVALRSLRRHFPQQTTSSLMVHALDVGDEFSDLYNKPESIAAIRLCTSDETFWRQAVRYGADGCLQAVIDEYFHLIKGQIGERDEADSAVEQLLGAINLNTSTVKVDSLASFQDATSEARKMRCHYAVEFGSQRMETTQGQQRASGLREVFNSPFRPFVLATTSIGQEGLDFHSYCRRIVHWNLPGNPVDLEQREGRINRFKSLVIRQQLAGKYGALLAEQTSVTHEDPWKALFQLAAREERNGTSACEMIPFWHLEAENGPKIERIIPLYPFSSDHGRLAHMLKTLAIYRLAFGQPRQVELVDHLLKTSLSESDLKAVIKALMVDLSPINYRRLQSRI